MHDMHLYLMLRCCRCNILVSGAGEVWSVCVWSCGGGVEAEGGRSHDFRSGPICHSDIRTCEVMLVSQLLRVNVC